MDIATCPKNCIIVISTIYFKKIPGQ